MDVEPVAPRGAADLLDACDIFDTDGMALLSEALEPVEGRRLDAALDPRLVFVCANINNVH